MLERYDPERSWHILIHRRRVEPSSLVGRSGSIHEVEELGSVDNMCQNRSFKKQHKGKSPLQISPRGRETPAHAQIASIFSLNPRHKAFNFVIVAYEVLW